MNIHSFHSYVREYIIFSSANIKGENVSVKKTLLSRCKAIFKKQKPNATAEARIKNASGMNMDEDNDRNVGNDKTSSQFVKGSGLFHIRHIDKTLDKLKTSVERDIKNNKSTNKLSRVIKTQTNGVAYNLEYIKRLMIKHLSDLDNGEKTGTDSIDGKEKEKKY